MADDEDLQDRLAVREDRAAVAAGTAPGIPGEVVQRIIVEGVRPLRAWREHRGLTLSQLSDAAGVISYISEIETGKKPGLFAALKALAGALGAPLESLA